MNNKKPIIISIMILISYLYIRLLDYAQIIFNHPLSSIKHDVYSYLPQLYFLKHCGFLAHCPYWYNGVTTFVGTSPGWYLLSYPIYALTNNTMLTLYASMLATFIIGAFLINHFGKLIFKKRYQRLFLFAALFGNNVAINSLRLGKAPEILAIMCFVVAACILFYYKDREIDNKFYCIIPSYALTLVSYHAWGILLSVLFLGLLLIKRGKELVKIVISLLFIGIATIFWWLPLLLNLKGSFIIENSLGVEAWWSFSSFLHFTSMMVVVMPVMFFIAFYLYLKSKSFDKKTIIFFIPAVSLVFVFLIGIMPFVPVFNHIFTNIYFLFMIFMIIYFALNVNYKMFNAKIMAALSLLVLLATIGTICVSAINTPLFDKPTPQQNEIAELFPYIHGKYLVVGDLTPIQSSRLAYYSYGVIYYDLSTPAGHYPALSNKKYLDGLGQIYVYFASKDCDNFKKSAIDYEAEYFISYGKENCDVFNHCNLEKVKETGLACAYKL